MGLSLRLPRAQNNIVVIGGGTGSFTVLSGLKKYARNITALVNMVDDGGSTGILRDELGALPPGDVRQCLAALSNSPKVRELFGYRFSGGSLDGHPFGNLFLSALEQMTGSFAEAVQTASEILNITGRVVPITLEDIHLQLTTPQGRVIKGQRLIADSELLGASAQPKLKIVPNAAINPEAKEAIMQAELIVIAPGDMYSSLAPTLMVRGVAQALSQSAAKVAYVVNLVTKHGETTGFNANDYIHELERLAGIKFIEYVIFNEKPPAVDLLRRYAKDDEFPVEIDTPALEKEGRKVLYADLLAKGAWVGAQPSDPLAAKRSYIRHDSDKIAKELMAVLRI